MQLNELDLCAMMWYNGASLLRSNSETDVSISKNLK